ncbi:MAG: hypothetical protein U1C58_00390 [Flavobacteriaceae bacterium]|nr:hypothetical protein [Flavobacteriaceae bacterium]MDZ4146718.1 hypothetical protein [Flavobacteriaceae bacterium]
MSKTFAKLISYLFYPILIPMYVIVFFFYQTYFLFDKEQIINVSRLVLMLGFFFPVLFYLFLKNRKYCDSIFLNSIEQRKIPVLLNMALLVLIIIRFTGVQDLLPLKIFFTGLFTAHVFVLILLYLDKKISLHLVYLTVALVFIGMFGIQYSLSVRLVFVCGVLITGLVASSRLRLNAHNQEEVYLGVLIGTISQLSMLYLWV